MVFNKLFHQMTKINYWEDILERCMNLYWVSLTQQQECVGVERNIIWNWAIGLIDLWFLRMKLRKGNQLWTIRPEYMENTCYGNVWINVWCYADPMLTFLLKLVLKFINFIVYFTSTTYILSEVFCFIGRFYKSYYKDILVLNQKV